MYDPTTGRNGWRATAAHLQPAFDAAAQASTQQYATDAAAAEQARIFAAQQAPLVAAMHELVADFARAVRPYWDQLVSAFQVDKSLPGGAVVHIQDFHGTEERRIQLRFSLSYLGWRTPSELWVCTDGGWAFVRRSPNDEWINYDDYFAFRQLPSSVWAVIGTGYPEYVQMTEYCLTSFLMATDIPLPS